MRGPEDCSTVTKPNDKGSCVIVWDRTNYILGAEKHVDTNAYQKVRPGYNESLKLVTHSTRMIKQLLSKKCVFPEECKYFVYSLKNNQPRKIVIFLPKARKLLYDVPGCPVIFNCGTLAEKC